MHKCKCTVEFIWTNIHKTEGKENWILSLTHTQALWQSHRRTKLGVMGIQSFWRQDFWMTASSSPSAPNWPQEGKNERKLEEKRVWMTEREKERDFQSVQAKAHWHTNPSHKHISILPLSLSPPYQLPGRPAIVLPTSGPVWRVHGEWSPQTMTTLFLSFSSLPFSFSSAISHWPSGSTWTE